MNDFVLRAGQDFMPDGLHSLAAEAAREEIGNVATLIRQWNDGSERFDAPGACLRVAVTNQADLVGVGALTRCPSVDGALRVRRFYVAPAFRRVGVATALATDLIARGCRDAPVLTCNAGASSAAVPFWEAMGFEPVDIEGLTHQLRANKPMGNCA